MVNVWIEKLPKKYLLHINEIETFKQDMEDFW